MKKDLHPEDYRFVIFKDMSNNHRFLSRSTAPSRETEEWEDGKEYPVIKLEISSESHPFFTGKVQFVDTAGRIDKFRSKYGKWSKDGAKDAKGDTKEDSAPASEENKEG